MRPNTVSMLDLSTGHLSLSTREALEDPAVCAELRITERACGWFMPVSKERLEQPELPLDLKHCLRYAQANGATYVLFDQDAPQQGGLPWYEDGNRPDLTGCALKVSDLVVVEGSHMVDPARVKDEDLVIEQTWTEEIGDADYEAKAGAAWIGIGPASVRLKLDDEGSVMITVLPRGREMEGPVHAAILHRDEFESQIEDPEPGF